MLMEAAKVPSDLINCLLGGSKVFVMAREIYTQSFEKRTGSNGGFKVNNGFRLA